MVKPKFRIPDGVIISVAVGVKVNLIQNVGFMGSMVLVMLMELGWHRFH